MDVTLARLRPTASAVWNENVVAFVSNYATVVQLTKQTANMLASHTDQLANFFMAERNSQFQVGSAWRNMSSLHEPSQNPSESLNRRQVCVNYSHDVIADLICLKLMQQTAHRCVLQQRIAQILGLDWMNGTVRDRGGSSDAGHVIDARQRADERNRRRQLNYHGRASTIALRLLDEAVAEQKDMTWRLALSDQHNARGKFDHRSTDCTPSEVQRVDNVGEFVHEGSIGFPRTR